MTAREVRMPASVDAVRATLTRGDPGGLSARQRAAHDLLARRPGDTVEGWADRVRPDELARVVALLELAAQLAPEYRATLGILDRRRLDDEAPRAAAALGVTLDAIQASPLAAALGDDGVLPALDADAAVARVTDPRNAGRHPDQSPWVATAPPDDRGWAWVFPTNLASARDDFLSGALGQGLAVVAKDGSFVADTGSAPGQEERIDRMCEEWLAGRLAARLGDPDPRRSTGV